MMQQMRALWVIVGIVAAAGIGVGVFFYTKHPSQGAQPRPEPSSAGHDTTLSSASDEGVANSIGKLDGNVFYLKEPTPFDNLLKGKLGEVFGTALSTFNRNKFLRPFLRETAHYECYSVDAANTKKKLFEISEPFGSERLTGCCTFKYNPFSMRGGGLQVDATRKWFGKGRVMRVRFNDRYVGKIVRGSYYFFNPKMYTVYDSKDKVMFSVDTSDTYRWFWNRFWNTKWEAPLTAEGKTIGTITACRNPLFKGLERMFKQSGYKCNIDYTNFTVKLNNRDAPEDLKCMAVATSMFLRWERFNESRYIRSKSSRN